MNDKTPYEVEISIKSKVHFDKLVSELNRKIGKGKQYWSMPGKRNKVLQKLRNCPYKKSIFGSALSTKPHRSSSKPNKKMKKSEWPFNDPIKPIKVTLRVENPTPEIMSFLTYLTLRN